MPYKNKEDGKNHHRMYMKDVWYPKNKEKHKKLVKKYKSNNRFLILSRRYGIPEEEIIKVFKRANGKCEICGNGVKLVFDHCHKTNIARGFVCSKCNLALGKLGDNLETLMKFIEYLK